MRNPIPVPNARAVALDALIEVLGHDRSLTPSLAPRIAHLVEQRERSLAQELCYGVLRWLPRLEAILHCLLAKPLRRRDLAVRAALLLGLYQLMYTRIPAHAAVTATVALAEACNKPWAKGLINAVLRTYLRDAPQILAAIDGQEEAWLAHPGWLIERIRQAWPKHWKTILEGNNAQAPMALRINARRSDRGSYLQRLALANIEATAIPYTSHGVALARPYAVDAIPGFREGLVSVQDGAAQLAAALLDLYPGHRVLDACAAPGGKTAHILETEPRLAQVLALDADAERLGHVAQTLARLGLQTELVCADAALPQAWWNGIRFDRILLDVPCSATGVIRRHPDIKFLRRPEDVPRLVAKQARLLDALWPLLAPRGMLMYATCSVLPEENAGQVTRFLARHGDARIRAIDASWGCPVSIGRQILPGADGMDGFYYALLEKQE